MDIINMLVNRIKVSGRKYGDWIADKLEVRTKERNEYKNAMYRVDAAVKSGNSEYMVDAINFAMFESMEMRGWLLRGWANKGIWGHWSDEQIVDRTMDMEWLRARVSAGEKKVGGVSKVKRYMRMYERTGRLEWLDVAVEYMVATARDGVVVATDGSAYSRIV